MRRSLRGIVARARARAAAPACAAALACAVALAAAAPSAHAAGLPSSWQRGVNVTAFWWADLDDDRWLRLARDSARADTVTFAFSWYQYFAEPGRGDHLNANTIRPARGSARACAGKDGSDFRTCKTPSTAALRRAIRRARALGLKVLLRPQVDVGRNAASAAPRKRIGRAPKDRAAWFRGYTSMLRHYARLARDERITGLVVGSGLSGMTDDEDDRVAWRELIAGVRSGALMGDGRGGFRGRLTYAAEWDSVVQDALDPKVKLFFWDALDAIGIDAYFPLVASGRQGDPSVATLKRGWAQDLPGGVPTSPVDVVRRLHREYDMAVRFTGLGYLSRTGTAAFPQKPDAALRRSGGRLSQRPQSRAMQAAFETWADIARRERWFGGIDWWEWPASGRGGPRDGSYSLQGKQAEATLCRFHGPPKVRCRATKRVP